MLIDWFTVAAQALNFLALVWLLKRFLYRPILDAIDAREKDLAARLADADARQASARTEQARFEHDHAELARRSAELLRQATQQAQAERARLLDQARAAADAVRSERAAALEAEHLALGQDIAHRARQAVFALTRTTLSELAERSLEQQLCEVLARRLRALDDAAASALLAGLAHGAGPVLVRSSGELAPPERATLQCALDECHGAPVTLRFDMAPELISGIELNANGYTLAWSIDDYLVTMEQRVAGAVRAAPAAAQPERP